MKRLAILSLTKAVVSMSMSQVANQNYWSYNVMVGGSSTLGDLVGGPSESTIFIKDIDLKATRPAVGISASYHMHRFSLSPKFTYARLAGNDAFSEYTSREVRNLSVRTDIAELNLVSEFRPFRLHILL